MEPKKPTWGSPADWVIAIGGILLLLGVMGYLTGMGPEAQMGDAKTLVSATNTLTLLAITSGVGLVAMVVGYVMKGKK